MIAFTRGVPATEAFPVEALGECASSALAKYSSQILQYGSFRGFGPLREFIAAGHGLVPDQVLLSQGALQIVDFAARSLITPGTTVLVEQPSYDRVIKVLRRAGATVVGVPLEADGMDLAACEDLIREHHPLMAYVISDFQNPSGTTMSETRRRAFAALADRYNLLILEDVPYRRLRYAGEDVPTIRSIVPQRTIQLTSFSKLLSPGLRVGVAFGPQPYMDRLGRMAQDTYITPALLPQATVFEFIDRGLLPAQIEKLHGLYRPRLSRLLGALDAGMSDLATWARPEGGFFVGVTLKKDVKAEALIARGLEEGIQLTNGRDFFADGRGDTFVRLPFCALTTEEIDEGVRTLAWVVRSL
ncbi:MAG TPA: PLP-dependent aminotransferase family protein [Clostridia bacterium]|nr:PLP-dependent aminotransferase family protein [Clostridia bacterium]